MILPQLQTRRPVVKSEQARARGRGAAQEEN